MSKLFRVGVVPFALFALALAGCAPTPASSTSDEEEVVAAEPSTHIDACREGTLYTVLDDGNAVELHLMAFEGDKEAFDCVRARIGVSEASFSAAKVGDALRGDGYTWTIVTDSGKTVIERD